MKNKIKKKNKQTEKLQEMTKINNANEQQQL